MLIYWLLLAYPAVLALFYPSSDARKPSIGVQNVAFFIFVSFYALTSGLRYEVGGDWEQYQTIYEDIAPDTLLYAITAVDPLYGLLNWVSARLGTEIYLVNFVCAALFGFGVIKTARRFREPWLAVTLAVPYLLIVVGMGYVRQSAALGLILIAIASFDQARPLRTIAYLILATGFHPSAIIALPLFAYAVTVRYKFLAVIFAIVFALVYALIFAPQLDRYEAGYLETEYESTGALLRVLMSALPSLLLLLRAKHFGASTRVRSVWISMALANIAALGALILSPSTTAVDRVAVMFSPIQFAVFGEFRNLVPFGTRFILLQRLLLIGLAVAIQVIWLVFATHSSSWVPYQSIVQFL